MQLSLTNDRREFAGLDQWEANTGWWVTLTVTLKTLIITVHITFVMPHSSSHRLVHHSPDIALSISYKYRIVHSYYNPSDWNPTSEVVGFYKEITKTDILILRHRYNGLSCSFSTSIRINISFLTDYFMQEFQRSKVLTCFKCIKVYNHRPKLSLANAMIK